MRRMDADEDAGRDLWRTVAAVAVVVGGITLVLLSIGMVVLAHRTEAQGRVIAAQRETITELIEAQERDDSAVSPWQTVAERLIEVCYAARP